MTVTAMTAIEMQDAAGTRRDPRALASFGRSALLAAILLLAWVTVNPFSDLGDARWLDFADTSDWVNQIAYVVLGGCSAVFLAHNVHSLRPLARPVYCAMLAWLLVTVATSWHPGLSARRLAFMAFVLLLGATAVLLPESRRRFCDVLAGVTVFILVLCFAGVAFLPELSIHQATDLVEPRLAGNWRGIFEHKNVAGEMMGIFVFVGLFVARARSAALGWPIVAAAVVFLVFTEAKAAIAFLPLALILAWAARRKWPFLLRGFILFAVLIGLNVFTIGSLYSTEIKSAVERMSSDPTFTGRTEIWQIALDWIPKRPLLGFGYGAFWRTDEVMFATTAVSSDGAANADHAHNAVLNLAVTTGIPGIVLALLWTLVLPLSDLRRCLSVGADPLLTTLFLRIWIFAVYNCSFESILFARGDPTWFAMLLAMFGLRYLSVWRVVEET
jgi:O-antigen ligase